MNNTWNKLCRACLNTADSFTYVINDNVSAEIYCFCTSVKVLKDDLPQTLCNSCYEQLVRYSEFKRTCIESENTLIGSRHHVRNDSDVLETQTDLFGDINGQDNILKIKSEETYFDDDVVPVKMEESMPVKLEHNNISDRSDNDLFEEVNMCGVTPPTNQRKYKKRRSKKLGKLKSQAKIKLNVPKKHFAFNCDICKKKFNYIERFEAHKLEHEGKEVRIHCLPCNKTFMTWSGLRRHKESEHTLICLEKLKCEVCGKICKSQQTLRMHKNTHGERKMFVCDVCGRECTTKFILKAHLETHKENRERLYTCEHCGKKFYTNTILLSHVSRRHTGRRFICQICSYPFTDKYNLAKHLLIHDGKKLYKCEICNKSYGKQCSLVEHKRIHSGERPYICSYCPKSFLSKRRLDDHHRVHTGERPHKCTVCDQGFTQRGTLKRHMKVHDRTMPILN